MPDITLKSQTTTEIGRRLEGSDHDNQTADIKELNSKKANKDDMQTALGQKADADAMQQALSTKADAEQTATALQSKADANETAQALSQRATIGQLNDVESAAFVNALLF